ncbi:hypothetical protein C8A00DRAFT_36168 [Chaetomidium leptoderma]|uniref:Uncharacterized protein n=1 Tax=Chaetomidium leptoderma TaxID=669021 RepID=A0AAN6ZV33_9PEZI|nr:hypothetical protein C8A00DRAFT_36168 [Chaetomidium leptoderma]
MASQNPSISPGSPALRASSGDEHHLEPVSLDGYTFDQITDHIVDAYHHRNETILSFHWQASQVHDLSEQLDARLVERGERKIRRFEYDYESETVYLDIRGKSKLHSKVQTGLSDYIENQVTKLAATANDPIIQDTLESIYELGTSNIDYKGKLLRQADSESRKHLEEKARQYIEKSDGKIRVALILDLQYPGMKKSAELFYNDDLLDQQPDGHVGLYISDFLGLASLPAAFRRPSTAESGSGVSRTPQIILTYDRLRAIFRWARHLHEPTKFTIEVGDKPENPYKDAGRHVAQGRIEMALERAEMALERAEMAQARTEMAQERTEMAQARAEMAQARTEMERRMAQERIEMAAEMERRVVE